VAFNHDFILLRNVVVVAAVMATPAACLSGSGGDGKDTGASSGKQRGGGDGTGPITYGYMEIDICTYDDDGCSFDCQAAWEFAGPATGDMQWSIDMSLVWSYCDHDITFSDRQATLAIRDRSVYLDELYVGYTYREDGYTEFYPVNAYYNNSFYSNLSIYDYPAYYYGYFK